jgi:hypothetical protein
MKNKLKSFFIFCNQCWGEEIRAKDLNDLLENRLSKRHQNFWSSINFIDDEGQKIKIQKEFLEQGMSIDEAIQDWIQFCPEALNEEASEF